jgi:hypothetical protein
MVEVTIFGLLLGGALSLHFKMFVLAPVTPVMLTIVAMGEGSLHQTISWIAVALALVATSVQLGYFIGSALFAAKRGLPRRPSPWARVD